MLSSMCRDREPRRTQVAKLKICRYYLDPQNCEKNRHSKPSLDASLQGFLVSS